MIYSNWNPNAFEDFKTRRLVVFVTVGGALGLIASQQTKILPERDGLNFTSAFAQDLSQAAETRPITMRDGTALQVREYGAQLNGSLVVMVHGLAGTDCSSTVLRPNWRIMPTFWPQICEDMAYPLNSVVMLIILVSWKMIWPT